MFKDRGLPLDSNAYDERKVLLLQAYPVALENTGTTMKSHNYEVNVPEIVQGIIVLGTIGAGPGSWNDDCHPHTLSDVDGVALYMHETRGDLGTFDAHILTAQIFFMAYNMAIGMGSFGNNFALDMTNSDGCLFEINSMQRLLSNARKFSPRQTQIMYITHNRDTVGVVREVASRSGFEIAENVLA